MVGFQVDPTIDRLFEKNKPVQTVYERFVQLKNCKWVDDIIPYDTEKDLVNLIATTPIDVRFLGEDYYEREFTADKLCEQMKISIIYLPRKHSFSSSELRGRLHKV